MLAQVLALHILLLLSGALDDSGERPLLELVVGERGFLDLSLPDHDEIENADAVGYEPLLLLDEHLLLQHSLLLQIHNFIGLLLGQLESALARTALPAITKDLLLLSGLRVITFRDFLGWAGSAPGATEPPL